jgi:hypothetical protein
VLSRELIRSTMYVFDEERAPTPPTVIEFQLAVREQCGCQPCEAMVARDVRELEEASCAAEEPVRLPRIAVSRVELLTLVASRRRGQYDLDYAGYKRRRFILVRAFHLG